MLVVGTHPVLAMHFCAGELYSFGVLNSDIEKSCCGEMEISQQEDDSCHNTTQKTQEHNNNILPSHENCCDIQKVEFSTDDYQVQQFNLSKILLSFENVWFTLNLLIPTEIDDTTKNSQNFPPGGFSLLNIDLLTYICIYRI